MKFFSFWLPRIWIYSYRQKSIKPIDPYRLAGGVAIAKKYCPILDSYPRLVVIGGYYYLKNGDVFVYGLTKWVDV